MVRLNIAISPLRSKDIDVNVSDMQSVVQLDGEDNGNKLVIVLKHFDKESEEQVDEARVFALSGDAFQDDVFLEWLLARQSGGETDALYQDLLQTQFDAQDRMKLSK